MLTLIALQFKPETSDEIQQKISKEVRDLIPTQKWTSAFCYSFFEGGDDNKEDITRYCQTLIVYFTRHAPMDYLEKDCSTSRQFAAITAKNSDISGISCRFINTSDLKAMFGSFYEDHKATEQTLMSITFDYLFETLMTAPRASRAKRVANANSFRTLGSVGPTHQGAQPGRPPFGMIRCIFLW